MQRLPVQSSDLVSVGYDAASHTLEIEFREGRIYQYHEVPANIYDGLLQAESPGRYFFSYINAYFRYRRVQAAGQASAGMGDSVAFVTSNARKLHDMQKACAQFGIKVDQLKLDIDEIQAHDPLKIAGRKADDALKLAKRPVVINDTSINIPALNGFPGGYMKDITEWFTPGDFLALMAGKTDKRICFNDVVIYKDASQTKIFQRDIWGKFVNEPAGQGLSIDQVVVIDGNESTIAERYNQGKLSVKIEDGIWYEFAVWYSRQQSQK